MSVEYAKTPPPSRRTPEQDAELWARLTGKAGEEATASPIHRLKIAGTAPDGFGIYPRAVAPPDELRGESLMRDIWRIGMAKMQMTDGRPPWSRELPSKHFADRVHRFDWLGDVFTQGEAGADRARFLVDDWIDNYGRFNGFAWRAGCTADRVWNWMLCGPGLFEQGGDVVIHQRLEVLARQIRHIETLHDDCTDPPARWRMAVVLAANAICLKRGKGFDEAMARLDSECTAQILPDGGHVTRAPARGLRVLVDLCVLKDLIERSERTVPDFVTSWMQRLGGMVGFFRAGDGALPPFNDGQESLPETVDAALACLGSSPRRFTVAPKSGFHKLHKGATCLLLDAGSAPEEPFGDGAHAGALGFELHDGDARLVTSCGYSPEIDIDWQAAVRRTSAHSTLILAGEDSAPFHRNDETGLTFPEGPDGISAKRLEEAEEIWLDAQHGGYKKRFGLLHRRRLFMAGDGRRLTGEDSLARPVSQGPAERQETIPYVVRFHLHPTVRADTGASSIRLETESGAVWRFKTSHEAARLEKTIYLGRGVVEQSLQIVLSGRADADSDGSEPPNAVRWAFLKDRPA
ncbi:heparinase II/III family protein [Henriciella aquimarina]|uniref:heparinase II/III family protein n=1 Tax=Henriciella aquimarina TaxID=545261 RepID=UPI000A01673D|nr:heparinase II/III family protein [Henriciella aquimarina]